MPLTIELKLKPGEHLDEAIIKNKLSAKVGISSGELPPYKLIKRSIDARSRQILYVNRYEIYRNEKIPKAVSFLENLHNVGQKPEVIIVGAGPAGYFAALECIELGIRPIVLDRGKDVRSRRRDLKAIQQDGIVHPDSNYCFGEGGAGTYSDGKLYTRSKKRGDIFKVLHLFVEHGAPDDIMIDAHPHIGTNKLPAIVSKIRETIIHFGGEVHFGAKVTELMIQAQQVKGVILEDGTKLAAAGVILATGHSARDIYTMLERQKVQIFPKPFALGVRVEHPQKLIDQIQYKNSDRGPFLPAASYSLVCQVSERGVFSFCMCPGGLVVPSATAPGEIVVNGMSPSRRDSPFANSGIVVSIENQDLIPFQKFGNLSNMVFQQQVERAMFEAGDGSQKAPALRLPDFVHGRLSNSLPESSYIPGLFAAPLYDLLPDFVASRLRAGLAVFGKQVKGYFTEEAIVIGTESRTSAPVRIPRDPDTLMHPEITGLFPCGEGAGFAGGIVSAALDGMNVARAAKLFIHA